MPAWVAGIQVCMDASGDVHVGLDSSPPCWNDGIGGLFFNRVKLTHFSKESTKNAKFLNILLFVTFVIFVVKHSWAAICQSE